jgi:hypothetical protein
MTTEVQIKHMVQRFLGWKLPEQFKPDNGISFDPIMNKGHSFESKREPSGTNLFDASQAEAMIRYLIEGLPDQTAVNAVEELVKKAAEAHDSGDAQRFSQAACNAANALSLSKRET